jgi:hypothetical protein
MKALATGPARRMQVGMTHGSAREPSDSQPFGHLLPLFLPAKRR